MISYSSTSINNCPNSRRAAKQTKAQTFTFQIAEHALHDDLRAGHGGASDTARALECADLDGGPGAVGKLDTGAALSGGRSIRAHGGAGAEGRSAPVVTSRAAGEASAGVGGESSSGGLHFALFRNRNERISRLAFHFELGCCSFGSLTHACHLVRRRRVMRRWEVERWSTTGKRIGLCLRALQRNNRTAQR